MVDVGKETGKIGLFAAGVAGMVWIVNKLKGTWLGLLFFRGEE